MTLRSQILAAALAKLNPETPVDGVPVVEDGNPFDIETDSLPSIKLFLAEEDLQDTSPLPGPVTLRHLFLDLEIRTSGPDARTDADTLENWLHEQLVGERWIGDDQKALAHFTSHTKNVWTYAVSDVPLVLITARFKVQYQTRV
jgi:hypothetical protein